MRFFAAQAPSPNKNSHDSAATISIMDPAAAPAPKPDHGAVSATLRSLNICLNLSHRQQGGAWRPRRATMQHAAAGRRQQTFSVSCGPDGALAGGGGGPARRKTCTHTLSANAGGELVVAATWEGVSILSAQELRRAADDYARFGTSPPSRVRHFAGVGPALLQPTTHVVRPRTKLAKCAWCPDVTELLASGGSGGGWLHYCRPSGAVDSWPLPCSPGVSGWTGLAAVEWLPGQRRALVGSSASNGVLVWDSGAAGARRGGSVCLDSKRVGRADCLAALPGGDLVMGGCGSGKLVIWDLRMASSSVRNFGCASKAVLREVDVARRVQQYLESRCSGGGGGFRGAAAAEALAAGTAAAGGSGGGPGGTALGGGGGCFFSQLLPCPLDARLLAFVQTDMQVGLMDCASGEVLDHASTLTPAAPGELDDWDARAAAMLGAGAGGAAAADLGASLGFGRPQDFRQGCCQSAWDVDGRVLYTAGALYDRDSHLTAAEAPVVGGEWRVRATGSGAAAAAGGGGGGRQVPTLAAVRLGHAARPAGCGVSAAAGAEGGDWGAVRHVVTSHHASAVYQDSVSGNLLLGTGTPLLLHVS